MGKLMDRPEVPFTIHTKDHEEYVLNAIDDLLAALDECAWAQVLPILGDEAYVIKGLAEMIKDGIEDHMTEDLCEDGTWKEREQTDDELYPRTITFYSKFDKSKIEKGTEGA